MMPEGNTKDETNANTSNKMAKNEKMDKPKQ